MSKKQLQEIKYKKIHKNVISKESIFSKKQCLALEEDWAKQNIQEICYDGGARSGKTYLVIKSILSRAFLSKESRHLIARFRLNHLKMSVWRQTILPCLKEMGFRRGKNFELNESELIITLQNGSEIYAAGLDDSVRVEKIMGTEFNTIFINEATQISYSTYQKLKTRLSLVRPELYNKIIIDCNPRSRYHWIYKYFIQKQDPEIGEALPVQRMEKMSRRSWTPHDNPYLSEEYKELLSELTGIERDRLYKGLWVDVEGLVYKNYEQAIIKPFEIPNSWDCAGAVDFGYTNPFVFLWLYYDQSNETWYLTDEHYQTQKTVRAHCEILKKRKKPNLFIIADHDSEDRATMAECGYLTIAADKDISTGIQALIKLLEAKEGIKLRIFETCVNTIEEFSIYSWEEPKEGKNAKEIPVKSNNHSMDALRYFALKVVGKSNLIITRKKEDVLNEIQKQKPKTLENLRNDTLKRYGVGQNFLR
ncbi:PBSX family phage terminase large subunit [Leptospira noguchii]|uniref:Terminase, large subunit, PBSX family n=1 Tax=Leptospira noguchii serovar Autumnalis str. ZUN142 TaxID=1085540 RepID=M6U4V8_9LEPT|nr:PBSX family phage terminase large subunit [Leptospira noguchii]EMO39505.1 terminase, large subunit, PBSX family [Leptospira noguchii serovar Autumnalis str. ZUN142]UOG50869.1 PBSX family phage terminase large subunit [Leptospira noguchii]